MRDKKRNLCASGLVSLGWNIVCLIQLCIEEHQCCFDASYIIGLDIHIIFLQIDPLYHTVSYQHILIL